VLVFPPLWQRVEGEEVRSDKAEPSDAAAVAAGGVPTFPGPPGVALGREAMGRARFILRGFVAALVELLYST